MTEVANSLITTALIAKEVLRLSGKNPSSGTSRIQLPAGALQLSLHDFEPLLVDALRRLGPLNVEWPKDCEQVSRQQLGNVLAWVTLKDSYLTISRWTND